MPKISGWDGVTVWIHWGDHAPPHFHARYAGRWIVMEIASGEVQSWKRDKPWPQAELKRLDRWRRAHQGELLENWARAQAGEALAWIEPAPRKGKGKGKKE